MNACIWPTCHGIPFFLSFSPLSNEEKSNHKFSVHSVRFTVLIKTNERAKLHILRTNITIRNIFVLIFVFAKTVATYATCISYPISVHPLRCVLVHMLGTYTTKLCTNKQTNRQTNRTHCVFFILLSDKVNLDLFAKKTLGNLQFFSLNFDGNEVLKHFSWAWFGFSFLFPSHLAKMVLFFSHPLRDRVCNKNGTWSRQQQKIVYLLE